MNAWRFLAAVVVTIAMAGAAMGRDGTYAINVPADAGPRVAFGVAELSDALYAAGIKPAKEQAADWTFGASLAPRLRPAMPEAFKIAADGGKVSVEGGDATGIMYGLLDLAETVRYFGPDAIRVKSASPEIAFRCIKFNLPWDAYAPSASAEANKGALRDLKFWQGYLDEMARDRFNKLSLWALHPLPYMVRLEKYPEAAIAQGAEMDEWLTFWRKLFQMADARGIQIYIATWNTFVSPGFTKAHDLPRRSGVDSPLIRDYMKESVRELVDTYPNLGGIITTTSEEMAQATREKPGGNEQFALETYVAGLNAANRKVDFVYRSWWAGAKQIRKTILEPPRYEGPLFMDVKFNVSHGHSHPAIHFNDPDLWNPLPTTYKMIWHVRNEDFYLTRWGDAPFVREHIRLNDKPFAAGYFVGSERATPGVDFYSRSRERMPWKYRYVKEALFWKLWGRLLYDPQTPDAIFAAYLADRYGLPAEQGTQLLEAYRAASQSTYALALWFGCDNDASIMPEGCYSGFGGNWSPRGHWMETNGNRFVSVAEYVLGPAMDSAYVDPITFAADTQKNWAGRIAPMKYADALEADAQKALTLAEQIGNWQARHDALELATLTVDFNFRGHQGLYYANKLRAGVELLSFMRSGDDKMKAAAMAHAARATEEWQGLTTVGTMEYGNAKLDQWGPWSWSKLLPEVRRDEAIIQAARAATADELKAIDAAATVEQKAKLYGRIVESFAPAAVK